MSLLKKLKNIKIFIPAEFSIATILGGLSFLFFFLGLFLSNYPIFLKILFGFLVFIITFIVTIILIKLLLTPVDKFIQKVSPITQKEKKELTQAKSEFKYEPFFKHLTEALSQLETEKIFPDIVCKSEIMRQVLKQVSKIATTDTTVLILGESGTGKELIAENIHKLSPRKEHPLIKINCAALPKDLIESELFGYEKGAFTGATTSKPGKFELANKGTILLDEIGDLPLELQGKLLRILEDKQVEKLGGKFPKKIDVRIIAATNKDLKKMIAEGTFREDLYFRLSTFPIYLPPLRQRKEDISLLSNYFLAKNFPDKKLHPSCFSVLLNYPWPGNVRELFNVLKQAALISQEKEIKPEHLFLNSKTKDLASEDELDFDSLDSYLKNLEKELILKALKKSKGVQREAAKILGIKERSLWHRIKKYEIDPTKFRKKNTN